MREQAIQVMILEKNNEGLEIPVEAEPKAKKQTEEAKGSITVELSMNSIVEITVNKAMKVTGKLNEQDGIILIDSEASHNLISSGVV